MRPDTALRHGDRERGTPRIDPDQRRATPVKDTDRRRGTTPFRSEPAMSTPANVIGAAAAPARPRKSLWPARLDLAQSASGLVLGLFMWGHMFFVSSILLGNDAMWTITRMFEGYFVFGTAYPILVSFVVAFVFSVFVVHAALAV